ncbi:PH domain-containing protein [Piscicoccus intestinalis]|uniref:PH domain-containing protein n=1 Tax=Piscicoccus intestinalis TaxID=746033 RepID=UPI000837C19C|nr:PH domain-containing protein [Piscicoccus intestinalis]
MAKLDKLVAQAQDHLEPGETVRAAVQGQYEVKIMGSDTVRAGVLIATDRRLVFYAKKLTGYDLESFPYRSISSFEQSKNMMGHAVTFFASGNRVHMKWIPINTDLAAFTSAVKQSMAPGDASPAPTAQPANDGRGDVMAQLKQLGELRDAGIVTPEEFDAKKAELLSRL